ncbi:MAG: hypothetical protein RBU21_23325, partial [FCB group bacterium]|nr:hypothetical protein [FCB group bacterium]
MSAQQSSESEKEVAALSVEEIRSLPLWATVALAIRCAMRVQPLIHPVAFRSEGVRAAAQRIQDVDIAITLSALLVSGSVESTPAANKAASVAAGAAGAAASSGPTTAAASAAATVVRAAEAARDAESAAANAALVA